MASKTVKSGSLERFLEQSEGKATVRIPAQGQVLEPLWLRVFPGTRSVLHLEQGAKAMIIEEMMEGLTDAHHTDIVLEDGAQLTYVLFQNVPAQENLDSRISLTLANSAQARSLVASIGGKEVMCDIQARLTGAQAVSDIDVLSYARGMEKQQISARNIFDARQGGGEITMRGVAEETAQIRCNGMIEIGPGGGGTNTYLTQSVLMLDPTAKVNAIPGLEIKTNDVKASHSATVARVTEDDLFYFASRAIPERQARKMFVEGFLGDLTKRVGDTTLEELIHEAIEAKYGR